MRKEAKIKDINLKTSQHFNKEMNSISVQRIINELFLKSCAIKYQKIHFFEPIYYSETLFANFQYFFKNSSVNVTS